MYSVQYIEVPGTVHCMHTSNTLIVPGTLVLGMLPGTVPAFSIIGTIVLSFTRVSTVAVIYTVYSEYSSIQKHRVHVVLVLSTTVHSSMDSYAGTNSSYSYSSTIALEYTVPCAVAETGCAKVL